MNIKQPSDERRLFSFSFGGSEVSKNFVLFIAVNFIKYSVKAARLSPLPGAAP